MFLALVVETHQCFRSAVDCSLKVVDCFDRNHLVRLRNVTQRRTCRREKVVMAAGFAVGHVVKVARMIVFGLESGFAE
jgi:hypothetical protein